MTDDSSAARRLSWLLQETSVTMVNIEWLGLLMLGWRSEQDRRSRSRPNPRTGLTSENLDRIEAFVTRIREAAA